MSEPTVPHSDVSPAGRTINPEHPPDPAPTLDGTRIIGSLAASALLLAFFLPWVSIWGMGLTGFDVTKTDTYWFVFLMPLLVALTLVLSLSGKAAPALLRLTGLSPFLILAYGLYQIGLELFSGVLFGGWLSLIAGAVLLLIPSPAKPPTQG